LVCNSSKTKNINLKAAGKKGLFQQKKTVRTAESHKTQRFFCGERKRRGKNLLIRGEIVKGNRRGAFARAQGKTYQCVMMEMYKLSKETGSQGWGGL